MFEDAQWSRGSKYQAEVHTFLIHYQESVSIQTFENFIYHLGNDMLADEHNKNWIWNADFSQYFFKLFKFGIFGHFRLYKASSLILYFPAEWNFPTFSNSNIKWKTDRSRWSHWNLMKSFQTTLARKLKLVKLHNNCVQAAHKLSLTNQNSLFHLLCQLAYSIWFWNNFTVILSSMWRV